MVPPTWEVLWFYYSVSFELVVSSNLQIVCLHWRTKILHIPNSWNESNESSKIITEILWGLLYVYVCMICCLHQSVVSILIYCIAIFYIFWWILELLRQHPNSLTNHTTLIHMLRNKTFPTAERVGQKLSEFVEIKH